MKLVRYFLLIVIFASPVQARADFPVMDWMQSSLSDLANLFSSCLEVPSLNNYNTGSMTLDLASSGTWVATGTYVSGGKIIQLNWNTIGLEGSPRKYLVMYRIDPRFNRPQLYIQTYDYTQQKYVSDFDSVQSGQLNNYQANPQIIFSQRVQDYTDYFNFNDRPPISVNQGDVINITLIKSGDFFQASPGFNGELQSAGQIPVIAYTPSEADDNQLIYASAAPWCAALTANASPSSMICNGSTYNSTDLSPLVGMLNEPKFTGIKGTIPTCPALSNTKDVAALCYYDHGRGMKITINGQTIKSEPDPFVHSSFLGKDFFYYQTGAAGNLDITTSWQINGMFANFDQFMTDWPSLPGVTDLDSLNAFINTSPTNMALNFLHFGRYLMKIEIGSGSQDVSASEQEDITVEYTISPTKPASGSSGTGVGQNDRFDAGSDGYLWVRVINPNADVGGTITLNFSNYIGTTWFSDIVYNNIISPLRDNFNNLTKLIYSQFVTNPTIQRIAQFLLIIYVILYGLYFLAGATKITVSDLVMRVVKITIIVTLFSEQSWNFFNNNVFQVFTQGTNQIMTNVIGSTSNTTNVFGFIDPIFNKYLDPRVWGLLFIQLLQIQNGLAFFAALTIYSMFMYFRAVMEVIIGYVIAFVSMSVLIALAPFFITFLLFEQTKSLFNNWLSSLFSYMIQPTILLVFFLLIDQLITVQFSTVIVRACWGWLIPIEIALDLNNIGIPLDVSFSLPFLPGIPFYVTQASSINDATQLFDLSGTFIKVAGSALLFYCYCLMAHGLVDFVTVVVSVLTNVLPARQEGDIQKPSNPTGAIMHDIGGVTRPIKGAAIAPARFLKSKVIDQKYGGGGGGRRANFSNIEIEENDKGAGLTQNNKGTRR